MRHGEEMGERYNRAEHPSHAVAAQPHFATSILPARLHSHSVDPFTEGMSHMPPSASSPLPLPPPPFPFVFPPPSKPRSPLLCRLAHPPRTLSLSLTRATSLSILSHRPFLSTQARHVCPPLSLPPLSLTTISFRLCPSFSLARSLARSCTQPKVSFSPFLPPLLSLSLSLAVVRSQGGSGGEVEVAPFAASRNLARCSFAVYREERGRRTERRRAGKGGGEEGRERETDRERERKRETSGCR